MISEFFNKFIVRLLKKLFAVEENPDRDLGPVSSVMIVRQHNQFGDLLASVSLFRAVKERYPRCKLTVVVSPDNYYAVTKNKFIDEYFIFNKKKFYSPLYWIKLIGVLKRKYDFVAVPSTVSISLTSLLLARFARARNRIGVSALNGEANRYSFLFDRRVELDWRRFPDSHVSDFGLELLRPFGISTKDYRSNINIDENDIKAAEEFLSGLQVKKDEMIIGFHIGAGKPFNRWSLYKFLKLIEKIKEEFEVKIYFTGSNSDRHEIEFMKEELDFKAGYFINRKIPHLAALISLSDLFITNDTGVMHVAGTTETAQISIFGPTNPFNWAPMGSRKYFVRKSDLIDDITVNDVFELVKLALNEGMK